MQCKFSSGHLGKVGEKKGKINFKCFFFNQYAHNIIIKKYRQYKNYQFDILPFFPFTVWKPVCILNL